MGKILIVEDDPDVKDVIEELLCGVGHVVQSVGSAEAALVAVEGSQYDLVLADLRLPGRSGLTLADQILTRRPRLRGRVILVTGETVEPTGVLPVIHKPFDLDEVLRVVEARLTAA